MSKISRTNIERIDIPALRALEALLLEGNVTRAADRLGISQPAMSAQLRRLREIFGDPILTRVTGGSKPTAYSLELLERVADILNRVRSLGDTTQKRLIPEALERKVCVVATDYVAHIVLPPVVHLLSTVAPGLRLDIKFADRTQVRESMERGEVDLGIGTGKAPTGRLHFKVLFRDRALCIASGEHHSGQEPPSLSDFCRLSHVRVAPRKPSFFDEALDQRLRKQGLARNVVLTMQNFLFVPDVIKSSALVGVVPQRLVMRGNMQGLITLSLPFELPEMPIGLYWHERTHQSQFHRWFRKLIADSLHPVR